MRYRNLGKVFLEVFGPCGCGVEEISSSLPWQPKVQCND